MVHCLVHSVATQERFFTNLQWIFQRNMVSKVINNKDNNISLGAPKNRFLMIANTITKVLCLYIAHFSL